MKQRRSAALMPAPVLSPVRDWFLAWWPAPGGPKYAFFREPSHRRVIAGWNAGADFVKIFPAATAGGPNYIRALEVPLPQIPLIVTGGVNQLTAFDYILAGARAIGVGSELLPNEALQHRHADRIRELARRFLIMVKEARAQRNGE